MCLPCRPCTVASLKQVDGVSEAKSIMLEPLLQTIVQFCKAHSLQVWQQHLTITLNDKIDLFYRFLKTLVFCVFCFFVCVLFVYNLILILVDNMMGVFHQLCVCVCACNTYCIFFSET